MSHNNPVQAVKLDESGLVRLFGELEARIMEAVWALEEATVHDICHHLGENCNYKTVMTVTNRLVDKGALERRRQGRAFLYTPIAPREKTSRSTLTPTFAHISWMISAPLLNFVLPMVTNLKVTGLPYSFKSALAFSGLYGGILTSGQCHGLSGG